MGVIVAMLSVLPMLGGGLGHVFERRTRGKTYRELDDARGWTDAIGFASLLCLAMAALTAVVAMIALMNMALVYAGWVDPPKPPPKSVRVWIEEQPDGQWSFKVDEDIFKKGKK